MGPPLLFHAVCCRLGCSLEGNRRRQADHVKTIKADAFRWRGERSAHGSWRIYEECSPRRIKALPR